MAFLGAATQRPTVLGALLLARRGGDLLAFACLATFVLGIVLYLIVMTMVFLRWTFQTLKPTDADPPAWIAAGAVAITVLAGSNVLLASDSSPRVHRLVPVPPLLLGARLPARDVRSRATHRMLAATDLERLYWLPHVMLAAALTAWTATAFGLVHQAVRRLARR